MFKSALVVTVIGAAMVGFEARADNAPAKAALGRSLPEIKFTNVALKDAFEFLRDITAANIHVNWNALTAAGVTPETQINIRLRSVPLRKVITMMLSESGASAALTFYVDQGVIEVTTKELSDREMITKVYDVQDLIMEIPDFVNNTNFSLVGNGNNNGNYNSGSGSSPWGGANQTVGSGTGTGTGTGIGGMSRTPSRGKNERGEELVNLIIETVEPAIWRQAGGPAGIRFYNGNLIVTAPRSVHEAIGGSVD